MEIKITKKNIIIFCIVLVLICASFCAGRFIRFNRISGTSEQLISGIISVGNDADSIANRLTSAGYSAESAAQYGQLISGIIKEMRSENEKLGISADEAIRAVESNKRVTELVESAYSDLSKSTGDAIDITIKHAEDYERLIESLRQAIGDTSENNK